MRRIKTNRLAAATLVAACMVMSGFAASPLGAQPDRTGIEAKPMLIWLIYPMQQAL